MNKTDKLIKDALSNTPRADKNINKMLIEQFRETADIMGDDGDYEVTVEHVEQYKKPFLRRFSAVAAAAAVVFALGSGAWALRGKLVDPMTNDETYEDESDVNDIDENDNENDINDLTEEDYPENTYDMTTKQGIIEKMANCVDFFNRASGISVSTESYKENVCGLTTFAADVTTGEGYSYYSRFNYTNELEDILAGAFPEGEEDNYVSKGGFYGHLVQYCDGEYTYSLNDRDMTKAYEIYDGAANEPLHAATRDDSPISGEYLLELCRRFNDTDQLGGNDRTYRDGLNVYVAALEPSRYILEYLWDFDSWDISGTENYLGRECIAIDGKTNMSDYKMLVDTETGALLSSIFWNEEGEVTSYYVVVDIYFGDDAEITYVDLDDYSFAEPYEYEKDKNGWRIAKSGSTFGSPLNEQISFDNFDKLPDLIEFEYEGRCKGYVAKDELFENVTKYDDFYHYTHSDKPVEGMELTISLRIYDEEGEFMGVTEDFYK